MATILQQRTIAKEVIVAWSHIIQALYILWGWRVHLWCVFYIPNVPWAAKFKMTAFSIAVKPWVGKYLLYDIISYMFLHVCRLLVRFLMRILRFECTLAFNMQNPRWPPIASKEPFISQNVIAIMWKKNCAYFQNTWLMSYVLLHRECTRKFKMQNPRWPSIARGAL